MATKRLRSFHRWMRSNGVECSDALALVDDPSTKSISVLSISDLSEGDLVATIPKSACLTMLTCGAREVIETAGLAGVLGLTVALMYERALGPASQWYDYFGVLPERECVPLVWSDEEVESLLAGTELDKIVKQDKQFMSEDWEECIEPLIGSFNLGADSFSLENYFSAKTLVSSRAFEIDEYHGYGMVPLADLFNHKTGAEHVHFTRPESDDEGDDDDDEDDDDDKISDLSGDEQSSVVDHSTSSSDNTEGDNPAALEMIIVRHVNAGSEVFNTYGYTGNAALLHRYGFTEPDNQFDIVNIELTLVLKCCSSQFSKQYTKSRLSLWRKLNFSGCTSQNSEYFEVSCNGEPQFELLTLLYIIYLNEKSFDKLGTMVDSLVNEDDLSCAIDLISIGGGNCNFKKDSIQDANDLNKFLLTKSVCKALVMLADLRESLYGSVSLKDDEKKLKECTPVKDRKLYHSLVLRISERRILGRLRDYASKFGSRNKKRKIL
ncbi:SET domain-containing protein [Carex rostrata]